MGDFFLVNVFLHIFIKIPISYECIFSVASMLQLLILSVNAGLELRKEYLFVKKILTIFSFDVKPYGLRNFVLSSFNLAHLTLDRDTDRYLLC